LTLSRRSEGGTIASMDVMTGDRSPH
jgi:hypothetical protein